MLRQSLAQQLRANAQRMADNPPDTISTDSKLWRTTIDLQLRAAEEIDNQHGNGIIAVVFGAVVAVVVVALLL